MDSYFTEHGDGKWNETGGKIYSDAFAKLLHCPEKLCVRSQNNIRLDDTNISVVKQVTILLREDANVLQMRAMCIGEHNMITLYFKESLLQCNYAFRYWVSIN